MTLAAVLVAWDVRLVVIGGAARWAVGGSEVVRDLDLAVESTVENLSTLAAAARSAA